MNDLIDFIDLRLNIFRRECQQQVCSHSLFAVETFRRCKCLQRLRRGHNVIWSTEARTTKHQLSRHRRVLKRKLLRDKTTKRSSHYVRTLDTNPLKQMRDIVSQQTNRLRGLRLVGS